MTDFNSKNVLLLGYGKEGTSTHEFLLKQYPGVIISVADQENVTPIQPVKNLHTGKNYLSALLQYEIVIKSPGISYSHTEIKEYLVKGGTITSHINVFFNHCIGQTIGITGSKGKSTTSALIAQILKEKYQDVRLGGNIGTPALTLLENSTPETIFVLELSSQQLERSIKSPHCAVLLDIFPGHLDHHDSYADYVKAKVEIIARQSPKDFVVYNPSNSQLTDYLVKAKARKVTFSLESYPDLNAYVENDRIKTLYQSKSVEIMGVQEIPLIGKGNLENTVVASLIGIMYEVPAESIKKAVTSFKSLPHRLEFVKKVNGVSYYNDSLASIPEAVIHAINAIGPTLETLIVGGFDRAADYSELGKKIAESSVKHLILFPETGEKIWTEVQKNLVRKITVVSVRSMTEAVQKARELTSEGSACALSPASPSFGLFKNYKDRGDQFKKCVEELTS